MSPLRPIIFLLISAALLGAENGMRTRDAAAAAPAADGIYRCANGKISIKSEAPLELIEARSRKLEGAIDPVNNTFAWTVDVKSFEGFNSPLQREHFNENYMESRKYPAATFSGKIIEKVEFDKDGTYTVRAKGQLVVHGVTQERIIRSTVTVKNGVLKVSAAFTVPLSDHNIVIPRIVYQKIAEETSVQVEADLKK